MNLLAAVKRNVLSDQSIVLSLDVYLRIKSSTSAIHTNYALIVYMAPVI
jgi:hypothetical protein